MAKLSREEILTQVIKLIHDFVPGFDGKELTEDSTINTDASMDSMSMILVITKAESTFGIEIPHEEWDKIQTLRQFVDVIEKYLPAE